MAAAAPPPSSQAPRATPPASAAPPAASAPTPRSARTPELRDEGTSRHDSVDADRWTARGTVKVTGDVTVGDARLEGAVSVGGRFTAAALTSKGSIDVEGPTDVRTSLRSSGDLRLSGPLHAGEATLFGRSRVVGAVSVDRRLSTRGSFEAPSLTAGEVSLEGDAAVPGDAVALTFATQLTSDSTFGTIRAKSVTLRARIPNLVEKVLGRQVAVSARRVEADVVEISGASVAFVRAPKITLGRAAHVTEFEGTIVARHSTSRVGFESKSPPPYGLRR